MGFNDHRYKTVKLTHNGSTKEYSQINVNGQPVWRKPISYTKKLYITDASGTIKSEDAVEDEGLEFHLYKLINGIWTECLSPENNDDLSNQNIIKYGDTLKYTYTLANGYTLRQNSSKMGSTNLVANQQFRVLNDFSIDIRIRPLKYDLIVTGEHSHLYSMVSSLTPGKIRLVQGDTSVLRPFAGEDVLYYGDILGLIFQTDNGWKLQETQGYTGRGMIVTEDIYITLICAPKKATFSIYKSTYGIVSGGLYRTAGSVSLELGLSDGFVNTGDYAYSGARASIAN